MIFDGDFHASWRPSDYDEPLRLIEMFLTGERGAAATAVDRVLSTVLFTDIVQSTEQRRRSRRRQLAPAFSIAIDELCRAEVARHRGVFVKSTGDGMLAHFDSPGRGSGVRHGHQRAGRPARASHPRRRAHR